MKAVILCGGQGTRIRDANEALPKPLRTGKWNKIEHRMFCHITETWRGQPLTSCEEIAYVIAAPRSAAELRVKAALDEHEYSTGLRVANDDIGAVHLKPARFHGEWNDTVAPPFLAFDS